MKNTQVKLGLFHSPKFVFRLKLHIVTSSPAQEQPLSDNLTAHKLFSAT